MTETLVVLAQLLLKHGPDVANAWRKLFVAGTLPTDQEWADLLRLIDKPGESYFAPAPPAAKG